MIEVESISKHFGTTAALRDVTLSAASGTVLGLLGPNGAGKTTLVRILSTLIRPDTGHARVAGYDIVTQARELRGSVGLAGQFAAVDELLTGRENLELVGRWYHLGGSERKWRAAEILDRFDLAAVADRLVKTYSGGMRRRLDVGASLLGRPKVLFLDEPTTGLDPRTRNDLWTFIEELAAGGTTVLLTTQYMEEAERLASTIVVLDAGSIVVQGSASELKDRLGGDVLEVRVANREDLDRVARILDEVTGSRPHVDPDRFLVSAPARGGTAALIAAGRRIDDSRIPLDDLGIRRPTLDDVFLAFTGGQSAAARKPE